MKFSFKDYVKILPSKKIDGRFNYGLIVGIRICQNNTYLGHRGEDEFLSRFDGSVIRYDVASVDCVSEKARVEAYSERDLTKVLMNSEGTNKHQTEPHWKRNIDKWKKL